MRPLEKLSIFSRILKPAQREYIPQLDSWRLYWKHRARKATMMYVLYSNLIRVAACSKRIQSTRQAFHRAQKCCYKSGNRERSSLALKVAVAAPPKVNSRVCNGCHIWSPQIRNLPHSMEAESCWFLKLGMSLRYGGEVRLSLLCQWNVCTASEGGRGSHWDLKYKRILPEFSKSKHLNLVDLKISTANRISFQSYFRPISAQNQWPSFRAKIRSRTSQTSWGSPTSFTIFFQKRRQLNLCLQNNYNSLLREESTFDAIFKDLVARQVKVKR